MAGDRTQGAKPGGGASSTEEGRRREEAEGAPAADLRDVRREITETHTAAARTAAAVASLAAALKEILQRQAKYERTLNLNSFVAYFLFTVLLAGGFFFLCRSRADRFVQERDQAVRQHEAASAEVAALKSKAQERDQVEQRAKEFWQLAKDGKLAEIVADDKIRQLPVTPVEAEVFRREVARARAELADAGFAEGLEGFRTHQWKRAATAFRRALSYESEGPRAPPMCYYLGMSLFKQGDHAEAARQLDLALAGGAERTVGPDGRFFLANALEILRQSVRARAEYEKFAATRPGHPLAPLARQKAAQLAAGTKGLR